jgi:hypothetical protein
MVLLLIFGKIQADPIFKYYNGRYVEKNLNTEQIDPIIVFNMAFSFFQIGNELETGNLKEVDLKSLSLIATLRDDYLLVIGLSNKKSGQKRKLELKGVLDEIHRILFHNRNKNFEQIMEVLINRYSFLKKELSKLEEWN